MTVAKIFEMIMDEARSRPGDDLSWKLMKVLTELEPLVIDKFEQLNEHFMDWLPDDMEELGKANWAKQAQEAKKKHDRRNL